MMGESSMASSYVKITKEHDKPVDGEINPGELNQPVRVPHLEARKCFECGQILPQDYEPPANEPWTTGILGCLDDPESCRTGLFCPCLLFGRNAEKMEQGRSSWREPCICHCIFVEGGIGLAASTAFLACTNTPLVFEGLICTWMLCATLASNYRISLQRKYHLQNSPADPCTVHCCLHWCAICQEHREMSNRLESTDKSETMVSPPATQAMNADASGASASSAAGDRERTRASLELHPL